LKYRADIDGLRAIAVMPVILYHAGFKIFSGGFVGVDVFFVISGFLITSIIIEDIEKKRFSVIKFYERRAQRILPALFFMMFICIPFAWNLMLPNEMKDFAQSLISVSLFSSNIYFWREDGYFDTSSEEKPLLHTWSLAVEEQYYLLFPIFIVFVWRYGRKRVFWMLIILACLSLLASEWGWRNKSSANFYLAPTRAWELLAGSITALVIKQNGVNESNKLALLGLTLIFFSIFFYDEQTPFPSVYTLVPVSGVVLFIIYADKNTLAAKFLSSKMLVGIGLISYSAYLWHQPLFAFYRIKFPNHSSQPLMLLLVVATIFLSCVSWRFVEQPFRRTNYWQSKYLFIGSFIGLSLFLIFGILVHLQAGFGKRFPKNDRQFLDQIHENNSFYVTKRFNSLKMAEWEVDKKRIFLVGDSYAQDLTNAIFESGLNKKLSLSTWHISARCGNLFIPIDNKINFIESHDINLCTKSDLFEETFFKERLKLADEVWFASSWRSWQQELIHESLQNIKASTKATIRVFGRKDFPNLEPRNYLGISLEDRVLLAEPISNELILFNEQFKLLSNEVSFIDVQSLMCGGNSKECKLFDSQGYLKTYDGSHLTKSGAQFYGEGIKNIFGDFSDG